MLCKKCGGQLDEDVMFCGVCGTKVVTEDLRKMSTSLNCDNDEKEKLNQSIINIDKVRLKEKISKTLKKWPVILGVMIGFALIIYGVIFAFFSSRFNAVETLYKYFLSNYSDVGSTENVKSTLYDEWFGSMSEQHIVTHSLLVLLEIRRALGVLIAGFGVIIDVLCIKKVGK